jgi:hypothetical protein
METRPANESRRLLKRYLSQYFRAKEKQSALRQRLAELQAELQHPGVKAPSLTGIPSSNKGRVSNGSASLIFKIGDIEDRIQHQIEIEAQSVNDIMDILDFLPVDSIERDILEYRHIDCKTWDEIMDMVHLSRSPCFEHYNKGLDKLISYKKVRATLEAFEARMARMQKDSY